MKKVIILIYLFCISGIFGCKDKHDQSVKLTGLSVSPTSISLVYGGMPDSQQITATAIPENATDVTFTWSSGNTAVATVLPTGLVTAAGAGSTLIDGDYPKV